MRRTLIAFVLSGLTTAALGATSLPTFEKLDANGNDAVSYAELHAQLPNMTWQTFREADTNRDGHLDAAEVRDFEAMINWTYSSSSSSSSTSAAASQPG